MRKHSTSNSPATTRTITLGGRSHMGTTVTYYLNEDGTLGKVVPLAERPMEGDEEAIARIRAARERQTRKIGEGR